MIIEIQATDENFSKYVKEYMQKNQLTLEKMCLKIRDKNKYAPELGSLINPPHLCSLIGGAKPVTFGIMRALSNTIGVRFYIGDAGELVKYSAENLKKIRCDHPEYRRNRKELSRVIKQTNGYSLSRLENGLIKSFPHRAVLERLSVALGVRWC